MKSIKFTKHNEIIKSHLTLNSTEQKANDGERDCESLTMLS